jgi:AcrR family transcriptional regulator
VGGSGGTGTAVETWTASYLEADDQERRVVAAAVDCVARWGLAKTSLEDIARTAGLSRATVYRSFPGGKDRLVETVICYELGRLFHEARAALDGADTLEELLSAGLGVALRELSEHQALNNLLEHEPADIQPHVAFHRLDPLLAYVAELSRPYLDEFLPEEQIRPAAELLGRVVLSFIFKPTAAVDYRDPSSIRRLVQTYLLPALMSQEHS